MICIMFYTCIICCSSKIQNGLRFWCHHAQAIPINWPLNECVSSTVEKVYQCWLFIHPCSRTPNSTSSTCIFIRFYGVWIWLWNELVRFKAPLPRLHREMGLRRQLIFDLLLISFDAVQLNLAWWLVIAIRRFLPCRTQATATGSSVKTAEPLSKVCTPMSVFPMLVSLAHCH